MVFQDGARKLYTEILAVRESVESMGTGPVLTRSSLVSPDPRRGQEQCAPGYCEATSSSFFARITCPSSPASFAELP